jgi:hypothetical protein
MTARSRMVVRAALVVALWGGAGEAGAATVVLPRAGQVGVGMQGQYGSLLGSGSLGEDFSAGPGLAVRLRYRMRYERGLGLSFENQSFDARDEAAVDTAATRLTFITSGIEFYQMFGTRSRTTRMLSAGLGLMQASKKLNDGETEFLDDALYLSAGGGIEHFFWRSWAYDLQARYFAVFQGGGVNHDFQASAGLIFYASY